MAGVKGMRGGGGSRPGSGRKALGEQKKKVQASISITPDQMDDLRFLRTARKDANSIIGQFISTIAAIVRKQDNCISHQD